MRLSERPRKFLQSRLPRKRRRPHQWNPPRHPYCRHKRKSVTWTPKLCRLHWIRGRMLDIPSPRQKPRVRRKLRQLQPNLRPNRRPKQRQWRRPRPKHRLQSRARMIPKIQGSEAALCGGVAAKYNATIQNTIDCSLGAQTVVTARFVGAQGHGKGASKPSRMVHESTVSAMISGESMTIVIGEKRGKICDHARVALVGHFHDHVTHFTFILSVSEFTFPAVASEKPCDQFV